MRILVTGADGFVGSRLVKKLSENHSVLAFSRSKKEIPGAKQVIVGDVLKDLSGLRKKHFDVVYHLAAVLDESNPELWSVNVEGTRNLLELCKNRNVERFVYTSSIGVLGETKEPAEEDFPYNPQTKYEKSKAEAERLVMDYRLKYRIPYTIVRSTIVYGPNSFWKQIFEAAREGYPIIGSGSNYFHLVYVDDFVDALVAVLDLRAQNQIYHVAGPDVYSYKETYHMIAKALGAKAPDKHVPVSLAKAMALAHETRAKLQREKPKLTMMRASIARLVRNRIVSTKKIEKELGFKPNYPLEKGLKKTVQELL
ncbi:MAG: NAD(P)-dependent oxidoreductase [Candidatus Diapherotrites archaeon]|nr:NAD(P)-dependent oxidoreductase [Candidatus Diapherotrites archaeon]